MLFDENKPVTEVKGISTVTWVNTDKICYSVESFKELLDKYGEKAFVCGSKSLRNDKEMCKYAAMKGTTIDTLYTFGLLDEEIILESLKASANGISNVKYEDQVKMLFERWDISSELFIKVVEMCPANQKISWAVSSSSTKNQNLKNIVLKDKELLLFCMKKDPEFYSLALGELKNDLDLKQAYEQLKSAGKQESVFYGLDGTPFKTIEEAVEYNQTLLSNTNSNRF